MGWMDIKGCCTLGVTWFNTSAKEADMALNTKFSWFDDATIDHDAETVTLHENGHVAGFGHSDEGLAVMYASYQEVRRSLHQDDIDGITSLYPAQPPPPAPTGSITGKITDASTGLVITNATVETDTGQSTSTSTDGTYTLMDVPTGTRAVTALASGYQSASTGATVDENQTTAGVDIALTSSPTGSTVSVASVDYSTSGGRNSNRHLNVTIALVDDLSQAVSGASVSIRLTNDKGGAWIGTGTTGTDGTVTFTLSNAQKSCYSTDITDVTVGGLTYDNSNPESGFCKK